MIYLSTIAPRVIVRIAVGDTVPRCCIECITICFDGCLDLSLQVPGTFQVCIHRHAAFGHIRSTAERQLLILFRAATKRLSSCLSIERGELALAAAATVRAAAGDDYIPVQPDGCSINLDFISCLDVYEVACDIVLKQNPPRGIECLVTFQGGIELRCQLDGAVIVIIPV